MFIISAAHRFFSAKPCGMETEEQKQAADLRAFQTIGAAITNPEHQSPTKWLPVVLAAQRQVAEANAERSPQLYPTAWDKELHAMSEVAGLFDALHKGGAENAKDRPNSVHRRVAAVVERMVRQQLDPLVRIFYTSARIHAGEPHTVSDIRLLKACGPAAVDGKASYDDILVALTNRFLTAPNNVGGLAIYNNRLPLRYSHQVPGAAGPVMMLAPSPFVVRGLFWVALPAASGGGLRTAHRSRCGRITSVTIAPIMGKYDRGNRRWNVGHYFGGIQAVEMWAPCAASNGMCAAEYEVPVEEGIEMP